MTMPPGEVAVDVRDLRVARGDVRAVWDLNFTVPVGQVTGLLGPSGCGKTTLMRAVVGVQQITGGSVTVLGRPAGDARLRDRIGYLTQAPSVYDDLTVRENLRFFARVLGVSAVELDRVLAAVDLTRNQHRATSGLSGGERVRVSLAVALLGSPEVLVLDEPPSDWIRCCDASCGRCSTDSPRRVPRSWSQAT